MPASSIDVIGGALQSVYRQNSHQYHNKSLHSPQIQDQLLVASKQVLVNTVEYERAGCQQTTVLGTLRTKYVNLSSGISSGEETNTTSQGEEGDGTGSAPHMAHSALNTTHGHHPKGGAPREDQLDEPRVTLWPREKVTLGWRKTFPPGAGMYNLGNTCYLNSSLQALFHIPALANWLLEDLNCHMERCQTTANAASFCSLCAMMRTLRLALDRSNTVIKPTHIHHKLKSIGKTLVYGRQEDAHEFIKLLLDHMEKSYLSFRRASKLDHRSRETTPLNQIFGGYLRQQVICPVCRFVSTTFSHFQDLVVDIRSVSSLDEALNLHFRKETLDTDNAYKCEKCRKKVPATKRHLIEKAPHVLLIQLKRFTMSGGKIGKHINIQRTIDISRFVNGAHKQQGSGKQGGGCPGKQGMAGGGKQGGKPGGMGGKQQGVTSAANKGVSMGGPYQYRLASMVIHLGGTQHGGHYTAIAEASSGTMFEFDDASVRQISVQSALMRNPYILFYEMIRKPKDPLNIKPVIRQSSEKALIRQNSDGILRPIPTSHSASSVNGFGHANDHIGEAGTPRSGAHTPNSKSILPTQKDRDRISFGLKYNASGGKNDGSNKPSKIILNSSTTTLLATKTPPSPSPLAAKTSYSAPTTLKSSSSSGSSKSSSSSTPTTLQSSSKSSSSTPASMQSSGSSTSGSLKSFPGVTINKSSSSISSVSRLSSSTPSTPKPSSASLVKAAGNRSSLVPYLDDSEDSETEEAKRVGTKIAGKDKSPPSTKVNGVKCKSEKMNGSKCESLSNGDVRNSESESSGRSNGVPIKASSASTSPFLPRALHVAASQTSGLSVTCNGTKIKAVDSGWTVSEASPHTPSECSSGSNGSRANAFTVSKQPTSSCKVDQRLDGKAQEKPDNQGWTVTIRKQRPELEKAHSVDCVLPGLSHRKDEVDSASLKSKASVDSGRSDHSSKSMTMKKSFLSLFTCVSSSRSPGSPKDEEPEANSPLESAKANGKHSEPDGKSDKSDGSQKNKKIPTGERNGLSENGHHASKSDSDSESESSQAKRYRDQDENEPASPSKKCRPENKAKNSKKSHDEGMKNGLGSSKFPDSSDNSKNGHSKDSEGRPKNLLNGDATSSPKNGVATDEKRRAKGVLTEKEERRKSGKEVKQNGSDPKEQRRKGKVKENGRDISVKEVKRKNKVSKEVKVNGDSLRNDDSEASKATNKDSSSSVSASSLSSDSDSSDGEEGTERWVERTKETIGMAKVNPSAQVVNWNGNLRDLSRTLLRDGKEASTEGSSGNSSSPQKRKGAMWDGSRGTEVVDELRRAGNLPYGTKVNTWSGGRSVVDQLEDRDRREAKKRSADDLYDEEFDHGKTKKVKSRKSSSFERPSWNGSGGGNEFQRVQDQRNSGGTWLPQNNQNYHRSNYNNNNNSNSYHDSPSSNNHYNHNHSNHNHSPYSNNSNHWNKNNGYHRHGNYQQGNNKPWNKWNRGNKSWNGNSNGSSNSWNGNSNGSNDKPNSYYKKHKEKYKHWEHRD